MDRVIREAIGKFSARRVGIDDYAASLAITRILSPMFIAIGSSGILLNARNPDGTPFRTQDPDTGEIVPILGYDGPLR